MYDRSSPQRNLWLPNKCKTKEATDLSFVNNETAEIILNAFEYLRISKLK